ncbi:hypothetical protein E2320_017440 [Naja naja]|nr:hypothetical protein E2320_017440 [Naja naja]
MMSDAGAVESEEPSRGSGLFAGFRVLGLYCNHLAHVLRYHRRHREFYLTTAVGKSFHTYNVKKLGIVAVSNALPQNIMCLAADRMLVFASCGALLYAFARNKEVVHTYSGHRTDILFILPFGDHVISIDSESILIIWDVQSEEEYLQLDFDKTVFAISAVLHPHTYMNKILLGSEQGPLQLWNVKSNKLLYTFPGWGAGVTVLEQAPAVDVIAIGLVIGHIIVHNIKFDETLMKFQQDWGPITAVSFRTDGHPVLAAGSPVGHIGLWDLEEKKLLGQMRDAHSTAISGMSFVQGEPLLITNGADNAIRVWIFDGPGGSQDGTLQSFSTVHERFNKSLGRGSINKKKSKKKGLRNDTMALPPITTFATEVARQNDWDGIIACHQGYVTCTTWNYQKSTMGIHKLNPKDISKNKSLGIYATAVDITSCGNFAVIGLSTGHVDKYNMQSGIHRGRYGEEKAHEGCIRGVAVDGLNQFTITTGSEGLIKFWKFKTTTFVYSIDLSTSPNKMLLHRDSGILGIAMDDFGIKVLDIETRKIVRKYSGHQGQINDMPGGLFPARFGSSKHYYVSYWRFPCFLSYYEPSVITLPGTCSTEVEDVTEENEANDEMIQYESPPQLGETIVTLSLLPESRWKNLLSLDIIKQKNKPKEPPKVPKSAPFFIPTLPGLIPQFASVEHEGDEQQSKVVNLGILAQKSEFYLQLEEALKNKSPLSILKDMGPSNIETELRGLSPDGGGAIEVMQSFLRMIEAMLNTKCDFELAQAYLALFLKLHFKIICSEPALLAEVSRLSTQLEEIWIHLQTLFNQNICILNYIKTALL